MAPRGLLFARGTNLLTSSPPQVQSATATLRKISEPAMELPDSIAAIGQQLDGEGSIATDPQLLNGADVFAAERARLFLRPWVAVDHQSRIDQPGRYIRYEAASRSILLTRDASGQLRALRNVCLHAGYPVCEAEEGSADRMICPYHGWEFAADGRLLEPDLSGRIDPARLRLPSYPVSLQDGLIFVDLSRLAGSGDEAVAPVTAGAVPAWLAESEVTRRARYATNWNWKLALQFVKASPQLFCDDPGDDDFIAFGPLSLMMVRPREAILLRVAPKSAGHTEIQLVRMAPPGTRTVDGTDRFAEGLRNAGDAGTIRLDREFFGWYWSLMSAG
jgi:nitrite reductase/ring-hydroxylating ferredoxin subunit